MYNDSPLGKATTYYDRYDNKLLFPIPRSKNRDTINVADSALPFVGFDVWNGYEFSWLDMQGIPQARRIKITIACESKYLIESKSFKLYLYSFANSKFGSEKQVVDTISKDLNAKVELLDLDKDNYIYPGFTGTCLDLQHIACDTYQVNPDYLECTTDKVTETLWSNLLKSNCLVTGYPDWGSVAITYTGNKISKPGLLQYIVSYRDHQEFHEHCVERMFVDIMRRCQPQELQVEARFTRRGGLDINPVRATKLNFADIRLYRQ